VVVERVFPNQPQGDDDEPSPPIGDPSALREAARFDLAVDGVLYSKLRDSDGLSLSERRALEVRHPSKPDPSVCLHGSAA
jgi:hypothetical protein